MKKRFSIPLIVMSSIVGALALAVIIMAAVPVANFKDFTNYASVEVKTNDSQSRLNELTAESKAKLDEGFKKTQFSVLHAVFEWNFGYAPKFEKKKDADDNSVKNELTFAQVNQEKLVAKATQHIVILRFTEQKTMTVEGERIVYDTVGIVLTDTAGEVGEITVYPYIFDMTYGENDPTVEEYRIAPVLVKVNTTRLFRAVYEIEDIQKK